MASRYFRLGAFMYTCIIHTYMNQSGLEYGWSFVHITHSPVKYFIDVYVCYRRFMWQLRSVCVCAKCSLFIFNIIKLMTFHLDKVPAVWLWCVAVCRYRLKHYAAVLSIYYYALLRWHNMNYPIDVFNFNGI